MTNPTLPDFAVFNDQSEGFKEFLKVFSNYRGLKNNPLTGAWKYYGYIRGTLYCYDTEWTTNIITPSQAIQLLTGQPKQLTEADLKVGNKFECIEPYWEEGDYEKGLNPLFYIDEIYNCTKNGFIENVKLSTKILNRHFILHSQPESVPAEEEVKGESIDTNYKLIPMSEITDDARKIAVRWGDNMKDDFISQKHKLASDIMNYSNQQTAHLQQQLKEAEAKIEKTVNFIQDAPSKGYNYEKQILFENMQQRILEMLGDYLDSEEVQIDKAIAQLKDPVNREDSELHIRMAKAAVDEVKKTFIDANGGSTCH